MHNLDIFRFSLKFPCIKQVSHSPVHRIFSNPPHQQFWNIHLVLISSPFSKVYIQDAFSFLFKNSYDLLNPLGLIIDLINLIIVNIIFYFWEELFMHLMYKKWAIFIDKECAEWMSHFFHWCSIYHKWLEPNILPFILKSV